MHIDVNKIAEKNREKESLKQRRRIQAGKNYIFNRISEAVIRGCTSVVIEDTGSTYASSVKLGDKIYNISLLFDDLCSSAEGITGVNFEVTPRRDEKIFGLFYIGTQKPGKIVVSWETK